MYLCYLKTKRIHSNGFQQAKVLFFATKSCKTPVVLSNILDMPQIKVSQIPTAETVGGLGDSSDTSWCSHFA